MSQLQCIRIKNGKRCNRRTVRGSNYCEKHQPKARSRKYAKKKKSK